MDVWKRGYRCGVVYEGGPPFVVKDGQAALFRANLGHVHVKTPFGRKDETR
jgi:hypothetical protein